MDLLDQVLNLENIKKVNRINPILMSAIVKNLQEGEYQRCEEVISQYMEQAEEVDIYVIFICFTIDVYLRLNSLAAIQDKIIKYGDILKKHSDVLSPISQFDNSLKNGIDTFAKQLDIKIKELVGDIEAIDIQPIIDDVNKFFIYCKSLGDVDIAKFKSIRRINMKFTHIKNKIEKNNADLEDDDEKIDDNGKVEDTSNKDNMNNKCRSDYIDKFASVNWYQLIEKVSMFQLLVAKKRFFESAIVYNDLQRELIKFDPKTYFPGLFFPLYKTLSSNARLIHNFIERHSNSLQWHIAEKLYHIDKKKFIKELPLMIENSMNEEQFQDIQDIQEEVNNNENVLIDDAAYQEEDDNEIAFSEPEAEEEGADSEKNMFDYEQESHSDLDAIEDTLAKIEDIWNDPDFAAEQSDSEE
ncbi:type VI secretion system protein IglI family protein [uncultured Shewanella sp.]|uniref:type VI secretion system protein IglI family protein n=1 Tax=uncultured Shewanella sp. TaxID=173975 RepID=UPI00260BD259|nr:type VI secretion system protein IglI family protein [uncultured Shewanella sp.]